MIYYKGSAYYQPSYRVDAATISSWGGSSVDFLETKVGIKTRAFAGSDEAASDMGIEAAKSLLAAHPELDLGSIGLLVVVTQSPDYQLPHTAAIIQHKLGLSDRCASFDISLGCSGFVYALAIAQGLMQAQGIDNALIITADPYSKTMSRNDRDTIAVFGDAASASWLSTTSGGGLIGLGDFGTDGSGAGDLCVAHGGSRHPIGGIWRTADPPCPPQPEDAPRLYMNGRAIFNFMVTRVPMTIEATLARNKLLKSQIDLFVFHQASRYLLDTLVQMQGLPPEKVPVELESTGNTVSSTIPIALSRIAASKDGLSGKTVLVAGFGVGLSWASNILRF